MKPIKPTIAVVRKPAKVVTVKARETKANLHVRWDEALFLGIVDITVIPWAHEIWHFVAHVAVAIIK